MPKKSVVNTTTKAWHQNNVLIIAIAVVAIITLVKFRYISWDLKGWKFKFIEAEELVYKPDRTTNKSKTLLPDDSLDNNLLIWAAILAVSRDGAAGIPAFLVINHTEHAITLGCLAIAEKPLSMVLTDTSGRLYKLVCKNSSARPNIQKKLTAKWKDAKKRKG